MKLLTATVLLVACLALTPPASANLLEFTEIDYSLPEQMLTRTVTVEKLAPNAGQINFNILALTTDEFLAMMGQFPNGLEDTPTLDPAEPADFDNTVMMGTFPPSPVGEFATFDVTVVDDTIDENNEVYILLISITSSDPADNVTLGNDGVSRVSITDDDDISFTCGQPTYTVSESSGSLANTVFIQKAPGDVTERNLTVLFRTTDVSAIDGEDYSGTGGATVELMFLPSDQMLSITGVSILDDTIPECPQMTFQIQLSNPGGDFSTGAPCTIDITDDDIATMGFEQTAYPVVEGDVVEVCLVISSATQGCNIFLDIDTTDGTATVADGDYDQFSPLFFQILPGNVRECFDVTINDDPDCEATEDFQVTFMPLGGASIPTNLILDPTLTTISISDDGDCTSPSPSPVPPPSPTMMPMGMGGMGGDPHYSILLPSGQLLCFSVHGEKGFSFNLISNKLMHMNALFIQDAVRDEITWIGSLGIVVRNTPYKKSNVTKLRFEAEEKKIYIGDEVALQVQKIERLAFSNGKLMISESSRTKGDKSPEVYVDLQDIGLSFKVRFTKARHLDLSWDRVAKQPTDSHGMIGQFFRDGIEIDELRKLLLLPTMDPVPVMRKPVWHFMEREVPEDQLCWVAMNPGYQGKRLIEGHYLDYLVNDVLSGDFKFEAKDRKL